MKKSLSIIFVTGLFGALAVLSSGTFLAQKAVADEIPSSFNGIVVDVATDESVVVVELKMNKIVDSYEEISCYVDSHTTITRNGTPIPLDEILPGDRVYVEMGTNEDGQEVARTIQVSSLGASGGGF